MDTFAICHLKKCFSNENRLSVETEMLFLFVQNQPFLQGLPALQNTKNLNCSLRLMHYRDPVRATEKKHGSPRPQALNCSSKQKSRGAFRPICLWERFS